MNSKTEFEIIEDGTVYHLPTYTVINGKGIETTGKNAEIKFVRGSKDSKEGHIPKINGILHETLLSMMIHDLTYKNSLVSSPYTETTIKHLENALESLGARQRDRESRQVEGTYKQ